MEVLIAFLVANPELVGAVVTLVSSAYVAISKRFGGERFVLMKKLAKIIAESPKP